MATLGDKIRATITDYVALVMAGGCRAQHHMPAAWRADGVDGRGWERTVCKECGKLIGYRAPEGKRR